MSGGQASGARPAGVPEEVDFEKQRLRARALDPRGQIIGQFEVDGETETGEYRAPRSSAFQTAVAEIADEIEDQPIPVEYKEVVREFYQSLGKGAEAASGGDGALEEGTDGDDS